MKVRVSLIFTLFVGMNYSYLLQNANSQSCINSFLTLKMIDGNIDYYKSIHDLCINEEILNAFPSEVFIELKGSH